MNILYDASTFDTDPFEPQPDGSETIFPFLVKPPVESKSRGYVELSYTLPQDSTLFLLLREKSPRIWKQKLDWIRQHGGLALVNIHPDYMSFIEPGLSSESYSAAMVGEFMKYVNESYAGMFWNPLARELAQWFRDGIARTEGDFLEGTENGNHNQPKP